MTSSQSRQIKIIHSTKCRLVNLPSSNAIHLYKKKLTQKFDFMKNSNTLTLAKRKI